MPERAAQAVGLNSFVWTRRATDSGTLYRVSEWRGWIPAPGCCDFLFGQILPGPQTSPSVRCDRQGRFDELC